MHFFIETTITHLFTIAAALNDADMIDNSRGIVSGIDGETDVAWIAVSETTPALHIAADIDPNAYLSRKRDWVGDSIAAMVVAESAAAGD